MMSGLAHNEYVNHTLRLIGGKSKDVREWFVYYSTLFSFTCFQMFHARLEIKGLLVNKSVTSFEQDGLDGKKSKAMQNTMIHFDDFFRLQTYRNLFSSIYSVIHEISKYTTLHIFHS